MKYRKLIIGAVLSLILVVSLFIPAAAHQISVGIDSVTLHLDSFDDTSYKNVPISIPYGYTFADLTSISGTFLYTPSDGSSARYVTFSDSVWVFQNATMVIVNVMDCEYISMYGRAFTITFPSGIDNGTFCVTIPDSDYDNSGIVQLTFTFGEDPQPDVVLPDAPVEGSGVSRYQELFDLVHQHIYGGVELSPEMNLTITQIATIGSIFLAFLPFIVIYVLFLKRWF